MTTATEPMAPGWIVAIPGDVDDEGHVGDLWCVTMTLDQGNLAVIRRYVAGWLWGEARTAHPLNLVRVHQHDGDPCACVHPEWRDGWLVP